MPQRFISAFLSLLLAALWAVPLIAAQAGGMDCCKRGDVHSCCKRTRGASILATAPCGQRCAIPASAAPASVSGLVVLPIRAEARVERPLRVEPVRSVATDSGYQAERYQRPPPSLG